MRKNLNFRIAKCQRNKSSDKTVRQLVMKLKNENQAKLKL